jgi:hypothetical protein
VFGDEAGSEGGKLQELAGAKGPEDQRGEKRIKV